MRTGRQAQQAMFLENLWKEMDKLSSSPGQSMIKTAAKYASEGYEGSEIVELLVADGFDPLMSKECVEKIASDEDADVNEPEWGFEAEDQARGTVTNNFDLGCSGIKAATEESAWEKAQTFLDENCSDQYTVVKVYPL
jgi:hypothetical protein